jgi:hypothetical protein
VPGTEKPRLEVIDPGSAKVTMPGPETCDHVVAMAPGLEGKASSVSEAPEALLPPERTTSRAPASTSGARFGVLRPLTDSKVAICGNRFGVGAAIRGGESDLEAAGQSGMEVFVWLPDDSVGGKRRR